MGFLRAAWKKPEPLGQQTFDDSSMHISQSKIPSSVSECQPLMIQSEKVEQGSVKVVHVHLIRNRFASKLIALSVGEPRLDSPSGQPNGKATGVVIASRSIVLRVRGPTELASPPYDRIF